MVGMKRPWPFSLNNPPGGHAYSPCKMPPLSSSLRRWDDSSHWHDKPKFEPGATSSRDSQGPSSSSVHCNEQKPIISGKQHASLDGGFLTLAPPHAPVTPRPEQPMPNRLFQNEELSCVSYQGSIEDTKFFVDGSVQPLPPPQTGPQQERQVLLYSFLPVGPIGTSGTLSDRRGDEIEGVDLRLKL